MTTTAQAGPGTATNLLFGPGANAAEALARQILAAPTGLDQPPGCSTSTWTACCWPGGAPTAT